ncbi:MAG TPA: MFS transporter [Candidatus Acidoferrales bacterium]|nr:MFS transporter [Candidatus Acidoferrales bacterium]
MPPETTNVPSLSGRQPHPDNSPFGWVHRTTSAERRTLLAGGLGWMLDSFDVALYSLVLAHLMRDFGMSKAVGGLLNSFTLVASAIGGFLFGFLADRIGRTRSLMASILIYSVASGACGLSNTIAELAIFRFILGLGMGGEWSTGAALVAETWRTEHRGKALGLMQSTYAIGEMIAAGLVGFMLPRFGWRSVFFVGVLPALLVFWIQKKVPEPAIWKERARSQSLGNALRLMARKDLRRNGVIATAMNASSMFGYWGLFTWIPAYLSLPVSEGGRGLSLVKTTAWLIAMGVGKWLGFVIFGFAADAFGRRKSYVAYLLIAAVLVPIYALAHAPMLLLILGPLVAFFGTGYFSGFAAIASELFPTEIRATAMGTSYNFGRGFSAIAPFAIGLMAHRFGLGPSFFLLAGAFFLAAMLALALPETKGKQLE